MLRAARSMLAALALLLLLGSPALADMHVRLNGEPLPLDTPPVIINGHALVPMRAILEALGATVEWDAPTQTITAERKDKGISILLQIGSTTARVNGHTVSLDVAPATQDGRTLVPLRFVAETLGLNVQYDEPTGLITIDAGPKDGAWQGTTSTDAQAADASTSGWQAPVVTPPGDLTEEQQKKVQTYWNWYVMSFSPTFEGCSGGLFPAERYTAKNYNYGREAALATAGCFTRLKSSFYKAHPPTPAWEDAHAQLQDAVDSYARAYYVLAATYALAEKGDTKADEQKQLFTKDSKHAAELADHALKMIEQLRIAFNLL